MIQLHGAFGTAIALAFLTIWVAAMWFALMMRRESKGLARWFMVPPPRETLSAAGLVWRKRYFMALAAAMVLFAIAAVVQ